MFTSPASASHTSAPNSSATLVSSAWASGIGHAVAQQRSWACPLPPASPPSFRMAAASGTTRVDGSDVGRTSSTTIASRMSCGRHTYTGPIGGVEAILTARRSTRNSEDGSVTMVDHLVTGSANGHQVAGHLCIHGHVLDACVTADHDQGRMAALGLVERADGVAHTGRAVQLHQGRFLASPAHSRRPSTRPPIPAA